MSEMLKTKNATARIKKIRRSGATALIASFQIFVAGFFLTTTVAGAASIPSRYTEPYPSAASKKGLQVEIVEDALTLGVKHAALNLNLSQLIDPRGDTNNPSWVSDGRTYWFKRSYVGQMDKLIKPLAESDILVNLILLAYQSSNEEVNRLMLHPLYRTNAPNHL